MGERDFSLSCPLVKEKAEDIAKIMGKAQFHVSLYFRALLDATFTVKGDLKGGSKKSKERVIVVLCCSITGEMGKVHIIGIIPLYQNMSESVTVNKVFYTKESQLYFWGSKSIHTESFFA